MTFDASTVTKIFLFFLLSKNLIESWLEAKNKNYIWQNKDKVPARFAEVITPEEHKKAAEYSVAKIKASQFFHILNFAILLGWTLGGGLQLLQELISPYNFGPILSGIVYLSAFSIISTVLSLPESLYSTFVIEERFGFNKMTPLLFIKDGLKGLLLGAIIGLPLFAGLLWVMSSLGSMWWLYGWLMLTGFQFVLLWAYPKFIAPLFNKFSEMDDGEHKVKVLELLERTGFTSNGLFVMDASIRSSHGNAYFTGFGKNKRIVFFDTLLKTLLPGEVEAVLAHELGHFKRKHVTKMLIKSVVLSFLGFLILGWLLNSPAFFAGHGVTTPNLHLALILFSMVAGVYTFFLTPISAKTSRKYEFEADTFAANHANYEDLISALVKLYKENANTLTPDPTYSAFYHSHPPALIRVEFLEKVGKQRA